MGAEDELENVREAYPWEGMSLEDIAFSVWSVLFGMSLRSMRQDRGLTQEELAAKTGVPLSTIKCLERGEGLRLLTLSRLYRLLVVLEADITLVKIEET